MTRTTWIAVTAWTLFAGCAACTEPVDSTPGSVPSLDRDFPRETLVIENNDGVRHDFDIYLATASKGLQRGLMFVRQMPPTTGMLFVYEVADFHSMWMKNTYIPLDIVFARADGTVASVIHDTEPLSLTSLGPSEPVSYVLELNAGTARRLNIGTKSRLIRQAAND